MNDWRKSIKRKEETSVVKNIQEVPLGSYTPLSKLGLEDYQEELVVIYQNDPVKKIILLVNEFTDSNSRLDIRSKIKNKSPDIEIDFFSATKEVIASLHESELVDEDENTSEIATMVDELIESAINENASDIHIESRGSYADVLMRIYKHRFKNDSVLSTETAKSFARVLYMRGDASSKDMDWSEQEIRDTSFDFMSASGESVQIRFHSSPIAPFGNFQVVLRLLYQKRVPQLDNLGYTEEQLKAIDEMITGSQGLLLFVGPTNSGKSTSMRSVVERIKETREPGTKIVTVEDPVEYLIPDACQVGVNRNRKSLADSEGSVYGGYLKATLRQDPDIVMLGEIRDEETAKTVNRLTQAGHKVLTTLHSSDAITAFTRLREIGMDADLMYMPGNIAGIIYQRLVPTLCQHCALSLDTAKEAGLVKIEMLSRLERMLDIDASNIRFLNEHGCEHCKGRGISGMTICSEVILPDEEFLDHMGRGRILDARKYWLSNKRFNVEGFGVKAVHHGLSKVKEGLIDPHHLENEVGIIQK